VTNADDEGQDNAARRTPSPSSTQDSLTRLWKEADSSYGHHLEALAELREKKHREQKSPRTGPVGQERKQSTASGGPSSPDVVSSTPMASLRPDDLSISAIPRSPLGHLKTEAVEELLQRAAWNLREVLGQNQQLTKKVEHLTQRLDELTAQIGSLEEAATKRKNPDELARALLASAQRTARAERDSARREAESTLKKARTRAESFEQDVARRTKQRLDELARVEALREDVVARLRGMLETLADRYSENMSGERERERATPGAEARQ
jgi:DNA repair exonuclease SbcCD ATPase subunit